MNDLSITYRSNGVKPSRRYKLTTRSPVSVATNRLGLVSIGERVGGMNGSYTVRYLVPESDGLKYLEGVEIGMSNGRYVSIGTAEPRWEIALGAAEKKAWLDRVTGPAAELLLSDKSSTEDAFRLFAVPELKSQLMARAPHFADRYSEYLISNVDSSVGNLVRRNLVGMNLSLCDDEQFDVFVCQENKKTVSLCLDEHDGLRRLEYRFGEKNNLELKLSKTIDTKSDMIDQNISFLSGQYIYTIKGGNSTVTSVLVEKNKSVVSKRFCSRENIESITFPVR